MTPLNPSQRVFSVEFFPPRSNEAAEALRETRNTLAALKPRFFSVTFGAGGSTQERTLETVLEIQNQSGLEAAPHLSCVSSSKAEIRKILDTYISNGVSHLVALRGDMPSGLHVPGELHFANELVAFIREETGDHFFIEVAAYPETHPQAENASQDLLNFKRKVDAGADSAITQYFFNPDSYYYFIDRCQKQGIEIPIVPGIMPITNYTQLARFSNTCGAEIPRWLRLRLESYGDDLASIKAFGLEVITRLCENLLEQGAPGLHFYSMNRVEPTKTIWEQLGLSQE
ncbi:MAG: methylenetetrahydrofolate reductase [NAD(P)H] [Thiotrichales bacterium]